MCGAPLPNLLRLRTFGCRAYVRPTTPQSGRVVPITRTGIFLGYSCTLKVMYYFDLESSIVKTATHARFDEGMNDLAEPLPNAHLLQHLANGDAFDPDTLAFPPLSLKVFDDPFERLDKYAQPIICDHPTLGFEISECHIRRRGYVSGIVPHTSAARIRNVRRQYIGAFVVSVNGSSVFTSNSIVDALHTVVASDSTSFRIVFDPDRYTPIAERRPEPPLHLSVDQLRAIHDIQHGSPPLASMADNSEILVVYSLNITTHGTSDEQRLGRFTRRKLRRLSSWPDWQAAEFKQLDSMAKHVMYGAPVYPPLDAIILRQHWNYAIKSDGTRKAHKCCDGFPCAAPELNQANTYLS
jgi:hypothetical protein